jgi:WD40 repeat protein
VVRADGKCEELVPSPSSHTSNDRKARLFLSYGRRDAAALAKRIRADLEKLGYEIWQDTRQIRAGKEWEEEIRDGLRSTQVVIALLSPHAVRRATDPASPDNLDSVCLDELSFARFAHPPTPVVPVMAIPCEPPFSVFRLNYIEMTQWLQLDEVYQFGFQRLVEGIEAAVRGAPLPLRHWHNCLPVLDFAAQLHEKRQDFVGRQWLFDEIDAWRTSSRRERALLVIGDPGIGKSAFVAEMIYRNPGGQVIAYHICRADDPDTLRPSAFVMSLAGMIASRIPAFAELLDAPQYQELFNPQTVPERSPHVFEHGLIAALHQLPAPAEGIRFILIDALDEALTLGDGQMDIVTMLATRLGRLPPWLRIVGTTRREPEVLSRLSGLRAATINAQREDNLNDIDQFISARISSPNLAERLIACRIPKSIVQEQLRAKAEGNFLYVSQALRDIECDNYSFDRLDQLPHGIQGVYLSFFERAFPNDKSYAQPRSVLEVLLAAQSPLLPAQIASATGLNAEYEVNAVLRNLSVFLSASEAGLRVYHKSLSDWLTVESGLIGHRFSVSKVTGHALIAESCRQLLTRIAAPNDQSFHPNDSIQSEAQVGKGLDKEQQTDSQSTSTSYALAHLPTHLAASGQHRELLNLLTSFDYISDRVGDGQIYSLARDIHHSVSLFPLESSETELLSVLEQSLRREAHFIEQYRRTYPQALFQSTFNLLYWNSTATIKNTTKLGDTHLEGILNDWKRVFNASARPWLRALRPPDLPLGVDQCFVFTGHRAEVRCLSVSDDGCLLISGSDDGVVRVHAIPSGEVRHEWSVTGHKVTSAFFLGPDHVVALCEGDTAALILRWNTHTGNQNYSLRIAATDKCCCAPGCDSQSVLFGSSQGIYNFALSPGNTYEPFDLQSQELLSDSFHPQRAAWSTHARIVAFGTGTHIRMFNATTKRFGKTVGFADSKESLPIALSPDGTSLAVATWTGWPGRESIHVFDASTGVKTNALCHRSDNWPNSVAFSPCSTKIASGTNDGRIRIWDRGSFALLSEYEGHERYVVAACFAPSGKVVYSGGTDGRVLGWDISKSNRQRKRVGHDGTIYSIAVSDNDQLVASGCEGGKLFVWNWEDGTVAFTSECLHFVTHISFSPDRALVATLGLEDGNLQVWAVNRGRELWHRRGRPYSGVHGARQKIHETVNAITFSPNSKLLACVEGEYNEKKAVVFRKSGTGEETRRIVATDDDFACVAFAIAGGGFAVGCNSGEIHLWSARGKHPTAIVGGLRNSVVAIKFHPIEPVVVAASNDGEVAAWIREGRSWERLWYRNGTDYMGDRLVFSPSASEVALINDNQGVTVYDVDNGSTITASEGVCSPWQLFSDGTGALIAETTAEETVVRCSQSADVVGRLPSRLEKLLQSKDGTRLAGVVGRQLHLYAVEMPPLQTT